MEKFRTNLINQIRACFFHIARLLEDKHHRTYLDREAIILHRRVDQEEERLAQEALILRVLQQPVIVGVHGDGRLIEDGPSLVEADEALFRVHLAVEFEHALRELRVCDDAAIITHREWAREAGLNVDFAAIDASQKRANDCRLVIGPT